MGEDKGCMNGPVISGPNEDGGDIDGASKNARKGVSGAVQNGPSGAARVCVVC